MADAHAHPTTIARHTFTRPQSASTTLREWARKEKNKQRGWVSGFPILPLVHVTGGLATPHCRDRLDRRHDLRPSRCASGQRGAQVAWGAAPEGLRQAYPRDKCNRSPPGGGVDGGGGVADSSDANEGLRHGGGRHRRRSGGDHRRGRGGASRGAGGFGRRRVGAGDGAAREAAWGVGVGRGGRGEVELLQDLLHVCLKPVQDIGVRSPGLRRASQGCGDRHPIVCRPRSTTGHSGGVLVSAHREGGLGGYGAVHRDDQLGQLLHTGLQAGGKGPQDGVLHVTLVVRIRSLANHVKVLRIQHLLHLPHGLRAASGDGLDAIELIPRVLVPGKGREDRRQALCPQGADKGVAPDAAHCELCPQAVPDVGEAEGRGIGLLLVLRVQLKLVNAVAGMHVHFQNLKLQEHHHAKDLRQHLAMVLSHELHHDIAHQGCPSHGDPHRGLGPCVPAQLCVLQPSKLRSHLQLGALGLPFCFALLRGTRVGHGVHRHSVLLLIRGVVGGPRARWGVLAVDGLDQNHSKVIVQDLKQANPDLVELVLVQVILGRVRGHGEVLKGHKTVFLHRGIQGLQAHPPQNLHNLVQETQPHCALQLEAEPVHVGGHPPALRTSEQDLEQGGDDHNRPQQGPHRNGVAVFGEHRGLRLVCDLSHQEAELPTGDHCAAD
eukprot:RCo024729